MDSRAREYAADNQKLLASDLIFSDGLETTEEIITALEQARYVEAADAAAARGRAPRTGHFLGRGRSNRAAGPRSADPGAADQRGRIAELLLRCSGSIPAEADQRLPMDDGRGIRVPSSRAAQPRPAVARAGATEEPRRHPATTRRISRRISKRRGGLRGSWRGCPTQPGFRSARSAQPRSTRPA